MFTPQKLQEMAMEAIAPFQKIAEIRTNIIMDNQPFTALWTGLALLDMMIYGNWQLYNLSQAGYGTSVCKPA